MKKIIRFLCLFMAAALLAGLLSVPALAAPEECGLTIAGVKVTEDNKTNPLPEYSGVFWYGSGNKTLYIMKDFTLTDSAVDTLIESDVDGLTIALQSNVTLTMQNSNGTFLKLNGDTTIQDAESWPTASLTLVNESPGGTGILVNDCSLTVKYSSLNISNTEYGLLGQGNGAELTGQGMFGTISCSKAAVSGFKKGLTLTSVEMLTPKSKNLDGGAVCSANGTVAKIVELRTTEWDEAFNKLEYEWEPELSTRGEKDPETDKYGDYDIDLMEIFTTHNWLDMQSFNVIKGSLPSGMSLVLAPSDEYGEYPALRLQGKPAVPGSYILWLLITGHDRFYKYQTRLAKVLLSVYYESDTEYYDLWIDGIRADTTHQQDILGDGAFSYDPDGKTLTIRKSYTQSWSGVLIRSGIDGLIIDVPEDVTLSAGGTAFQLEKTARFRGEGQLTVRSTGGDGIKASNGATVSLWQADLSVEAKGTAVAGSGGGERLYFQNVRLRAKGGVKAVAGFSGGITLYPPDVTLIKTPAGGKVSGGSIVNSDGSAAPEAEVNTVKTYGLKIAGTTVTEDNRRDVLGDGAFSFDGEKTLTVKKDFTTGPTDYYTHIIENEGLDGLVIRVEGDVTLTIDPNCMGMPIHTARETTITGPGRLKLVCGPMCFNPALSARADLTIKDLGLIVTGGSWAIQGNSMYPNKLVIENSDVRAASTSKNAAVCDFPNGIELVGCKITLPREGEINGGTIVGPDGSTAYKVTIRPLTSVTGVKLDRTTMTLTEGGSKTLTASLAPENASNRSVLWESSDPAVAAVDSGGTVTGVSEGTATVTVKTVDGGMTASCEVTVTAPVHVTGVSLTRSEMTIAENSVVFLTDNVTVIPDNATDKAVTWHSSDPSVAAVDAVGMVSGVSEGTAVITVKTKDGGKTAQIKFTIVAGNPVESVTLDREELTIPFGGSAVLKATVSPHDATNPAVTWYSDDPAVAKVSLSGRVTAVSAGIAKITVKTADGGKTAACTVTVDPPVHVTGVTLDRTELTLVAGQSPYDQETLKVTVSPADATDKEVTWATSDFEIASVYNGIVTGKTKGVADVTVKSKDGEKTAVCKVTVIDPIHVTRVSIDPSMSLVIGESKTMTPVFTPSDATNKLVIWSSSDEAVVKVDSYGVVTGVSEGAAAISALTVDGGKTALCVVTVTKPKVTGVTLDKTSLSLTVGSTGTLKATVKPDGADNGVTWSSSDKTVATVSSSGKVTAVKAGTAVITVKTKDGGKTAKCTVTVTVPVSGVTLNKTSVTLVAGESIALKATVKPADASDKKVTWSSSKTAVATVSSSGKVTAVKAGTAVITVKTADGGKTAKCTVTVKNGAISVSEDTLSYKVSLPGSGGKALLVAAWYDAGGRQTGCSIVETARDGLKTGTVSVKKGQSSYRLYVLDSSTKPLMAPLTL